MTNLLSKIREKAKRILKKEEEENTPDFTDSSIGCVATMPRSGTWYHNYFFYYYRQLALGKKAEEIREHLLAHPDAAPNSGVVYSDSASLGVAHFFVSHFACPGFEDACRDWAFDAAWAALDYHDQGQNVSGRFVRRNQAFLSPQQNPDVRIVYVYRNPLDQTLSYYRHCEHHKRKDLLAFTTADGEFIPRVSLPQFFHLVNVEAYLKQFLTYKRMHSLFPENILMCSYEALMADPAAHFQGIIRFMRGDGQADATQVMEALRMTNPEAMKAFENQLGHALGNDQEDKGERHIRGGKVGKWREFLTDEDLQAAEARFNAFDLSLADFELGGEKPAFLVREGGGAK